MKKPKKVVGKYVYSTKPNMPPDEEITQTLSDLPEQLGFFGLAKRLGSESEGDRSQGIDTFREHCGRS